jgi:hypothetical protein
MSRILQTLFGVLILTAIVAPVVWLIQAVDFVPAVMAFALLFGLMPAPQSWVDRARQLEEEDADR